MRSWVVSVEPAARPELAAQQRTAALGVCEVVSRAIGTGDDSPLRCFTVDVLGLPLKWSPYVAIAMWESKWREADNPFGWIRKVSVLTVKKWRPELVGQSWRERDGRAVLASDLDSVHANDGYAYQEGAAGALGFHAHLAEDGCVVSRSGVVMVGNGHKRNGRRWRNPNVPKPPRKLRTDPRIGADERALIDARLSGYTRQTAKGYLGWSQSKVERVWRRINRDQSAN
jgi:hypothetical protein